MKLIVQIPAYNEEATIAQVIRSRVTGSVLIASQRVYLPLARKVLP